MRTRGYAPGQCKRMFSGYKNVSRMLASGPAVPLGLQRVISGHVSVKLHTDLDGIFVCHEDTSTHVEFGT